MTATQTIMGKLFRNFASSLGARNYFTVLVSFGNENIYWKLSEKYSLYTMVVFNHAGNHVSIKFSIVFVLNHCFAHNKLPKSHYFWMITYKTRRRRECHPSCLTTLNWPILFPSPIFFPINLACSMQMCPHWSETKKEPLIWKGYQAILCQISDRIISRIEFLLHFSEQSGHFCMLSNRKEKFRSVQCGQSVNPSIKQIPCL